LPLKFKRLSTIECDRKSGRLPRLNTPSTIKASQLSSTLARNRDAWLRVRAAPAMKEHRSSFVRRKIRFVELRQRHVMRARNLLAGVLIGFPDIDQDRTLIHQALGIFGRDGGKCHEVLLLQISSAPFRGRAKRSIQHRKQLLDSFIGYAVPESLALATECDATLFPHLCQMLREGGLR
jgi:hypothetical protein